MKKFIHYALDLNNLKKTLGYNTLWQAVKSDLRLEILNNPINLLKPSSDHFNILVLAPHPDDDVFGLGGTLHKFHKNGDRITVIYMCDGSKGTPEGIRDSSLIMKRKRETTDAAKIIGIDLPIFWGYKDGTLQVSKTSLKALCNLFEKMQPDIIFLPSITDDHPDHKATNEIFYYSYFKYPEKPLEFNTMIAQYEIWTPIMPNRIIDISDVVSQKKEAIACHKTQLRSRNYDKAIIALNEYRGELNGIKGYGEAFFLSNPEIYRRLFEKLK